jgi:MalT-like TPR region
MTQGTEWQRQAGVPNPAAYIAGMQEPIRRSVAKAMRRRAAALHGRAEASRESLDPDALTGLLTRAVDWNVIHESEGFVDYVRGLVDLVVRQGPGESFRRRDDFVDALSRAIASLEESGQPTSDLHLAAATYYTTLSNGSDRRQQAIQAAVNAARDTEQQLRALVVLAKFHIDVSDYPQAQKVLDQCEALIISAPRYSRLLIDVLLTRGLATFYGDPRRALTYFERVVAMKEGLESTREVNDTVATAYHFIGRIQALHGRYQEALSSMVEGQQWRERTGGSDRKALGFFHVRLAEILLDVCRAASANVHLAEGARVFRSLQETSTGEATFDAVIARVFQLQGRSTDAAELLDAAIAKARRDRHPRAELDFMFQRMRVAVSQHDAGSVVRIVRRALPLWWSTEVRGSGRIDVAAAIKAMRVALLMVTRQLIANRKQQQSSEIECPCRRCTNDT